jgi:phosphoglycerate dehydrogenase-like enzyme
MTVRIAVIDDYQDVARSSANWSMLPGNAEVTFFHDPRETEDDLVVRLEPFEIVGVMRERTAFPRSVLTRLPNLRLLASTGRRNAAIDEVAAEELGIVVSSTSSPGHATAELTMSLILSLARGLTEESRSVATGGWQVGIGRDLRGANLGLVGLGRLGSQVASLAAGFGMNVGAWSENLTTERCAEVGVRKLSRSDLFRDSTFVSIHLRMSERTVGLVGNAELESMKPDAYLINTSRAAIVDQDALVRALESGAIAGAAVDVFDEEPLASADRLRNIPGLLVTPHIGYVTKETYEVFYGEMVAAIADYLRKRETTNSV